MKSLVSVFLLLAIINTIRSNIWDSMFSSDPEIKIPSDGMYYFTETPITEEIVDESNSSLLESLYAKLGYSVLYNSLRLDLYSKFFVSEEEFEIDKIDNTRVFSILIYFSGKSMKILPINDTFDIEKDQSKCRIYHNSIFESLSMSKLLRLLTLASYSENSDNEEIKNIVFKDLGIGVISSNPENSLLDFLSKNDTTNRLNLANNIKALMLFISSFNSQSTNFLSLEDLSFQMSINKKGDPQNFFIKAKNDILFESYLHLEETPIQSIYDYLFNRFLNIKCDTEIQNSDDINQIISDLLIDILFN